MVSLPRCLMLLVAAAFVAPSSISAADESSQPNKAAQMTCDPKNACIIVEISGFENNDGQVLVALFRSSKGFPDDVGKATESVAAKLSKKKATVVFRDVDPGDFAVAVHHDEDSDFKMATNWLGVPKEAYGASRNARRRFGPPRYNDARLVLKPGEHKTIQIKVD